MIKFFIMLVFIFVFSVCLFWMKVNTRKHKSFQGNNILKQKEMIRVFFYLKQKKRHRMGVTGKGALHETVFDGDFWKSRAVLFISVTSASSTLPGTQQILEEQN